ncbi:MAG: protein phosphatase CheZ [Rhodospirillales bacterium]
MRADIEDTGLQAKIDQISANNMGLFEACSFQDITGQRITKVVRSLTYVETRVDKLIEAWGRSELENVTVALDRNKTDYEKLIHGPQRPNEAISQDDIDALFD